MLRSELRMSFLKEINPSDHNDIHSMMETFRYSVGNKIKEWRNV